MKQPSFSNLIIGETDDYLFINKPPGISTLEDRASPIHLLELAKQHDSELQACHRLDKETSGVMVFSRNGDAYRCAAIQFENRQVTKIYHALVGGRATFKDEKVDQPIRVSNKTVGVRHDGKEAITLFNSLEIFGQHTLVECRPETGRMHQIRIHLAFLGHSIVGDSVYGGKPFMLSEVKKNYNLKRWTEERPLVSRVALHASFIELKMQDGTLVNAEAPYPKDLMAAVTQLRKWS